MAREDVRLRAAVQGALKAFVDAPVGRAAGGLLDAMGYRSLRTADFSNEPGRFLDEVEHDGVRATPIRRELLRVDEWRECAFVRQLTNAEIPFFGAEQGLIATSRVKVQTQQLESMVVLAIDLGAGRWSRSDLVRVTRELNRAFPMPAVMVLRHGAPDGTGPLVSIAVIDRKVGVRDPGRDVVGGRVSVIKDMSPAAPHHAHVKILSELCFEGLASAPSDFRALYSAWLGVLSTEALNKRFYKELSEWFAWATGEVEFPKGGGKEPAPRHQISVIRLLTRLIFVWFIRERGLVPAAFFDTARLRELLRRDPGAHGDEGTYYLAVLQNLFFAALNVEPGLERKWADGGPGMKGDRLVHSLYRHRELFAAPDEALRLFREVPFLNGGLFECLDRELDDRDFERNKALKKIADKEGSGYVLRVDGFSRRKEAQPKVPNRLFFGDETAIDLNEHFGTRGKSYAVRGLFRILDAYKFTIEENTPVEEEVALDPELLGRVFENLLASYNEDTRESARKKSGSFYTPRVVVDYMVDEALIAYLRPCVAADAVGEAGLRALFAYGDDRNPFGPGETAAIIAAIERMKILDPACGSGAFPMGALGKLVHALSKLDPGNELWKRQNRLPLEEQLRKAEEVPDAALQEERRDEAIAALKKFDDDFAGEGHAEYTRKLYLIEKCIHGVDIQPIAVQIAKLRFFISLVVSQRLDPKKGNRGVTALPNLETKIVAANSLIPAKREQLSLRSETVKRCERDLARASKGYFGARTHKTKRKYRGEIIARREELAELFRKEDMLTATEARRLGSWDPFDQNGHAGVFDPEWMFQVTEGYDVCLGNPPYVRQERIKDDKKDYQDVYDCYAGTADLYVYFYERSIKLLKPGGAIAFITSNKWFRAKYGEKLRQWMNWNTRVERVIDFGDAPVFDAIAYPAIVVATRRPSRVMRPADDEVVRALNWVAGEREVGEFPAVFAQEGFEVPQAELKGEGWHFEVPIKRRLLDRIRSVGVTLDEHVGGRFYRGISSGLNDVFVVTGADREALVTQGVDVRTVLKPYLQGRDVKRWTVESSDRWLLYIPWHFPLHDSLDIVGASATAEREFRRRYPTIYEHLAASRKELEARDQTETGIRYEWYALQRPRTEIEKEILGPKIVYPDIYLHQSFAWDDQGYYPGNTCYFISTSEKWLCGVLNAPVTEWFYEQIASRIMNGYLRAFSDKMQSIRIPNADDRQREAIESLVTVMTTAPDPHIERLLSGLVYELFFPEDLHAAGVHLFDAARAAGVADGAPVALAATLRDNGSELFRQLFALRSLDVVRIIEGDA